jgi:hypothetical protein
LTNFSTQLTNRREASASVEKKQEESIFAARAEAEAAESAQAGDAGDDELEKFTSIQVPASVQDPGVQLPDCLPACLY